MTQRRARVKVPASSANLGPGYDVLAAALELQLELEVEETGEFTVDVGELNVPADRTNLCVRAFERLHSADGLRFKLASEIPLAAGLGYKDGRPESVIASPYIIFSIPASYAAASHIGQAGDDEYSHLNPDY